MTKTKKKENILKKLDFSKIPLYFITILFTISLLLSLLIHNYLLLIFILILIMFISFKLKIGKFGLWLFVVSLISKILVILIFKPPIESDFASMYEASQLLARGDLSYTLNMYYIRWGYQVGHVLYQAILLKLFNSVFVLKLANCLFLSGTTLLIYLTLKKLINEELARVSSLLYMVYLHPVMLTTILTNQHAPTFLFYLALYILISNDKLKDITKYLVIGLLIAIGNIMRPEGIIFILTIIVYLLFNSIKSHQYRVNVKRIIVLILCYLFITKGVSFAFKVSGISQSGLENKDPLWKFVLGTNYEKGGWYDTNDEVYLGDSEKELAVIKERTIGNPIQFIKLLTIKARVFWIDTNLYWSNTYLDSTNLKIGNREIYGSNVNNLMNFLNEKIYHITFILSLIGFIGLYRKKYDLDKVDLYIILTILYYLVYLLIENMIRYTYTPRVAVFILSGYGLKYLSDLLTKANKSRLLVKN